MSVGMGRGRGEGAVDYVVVGAGSAGCAVAGRLSEDAGARVALLEAGGSDRKLEVKVPVAFSNQFLTDLDWKLFSEPEPNFAGRQIYLPRGRSLGGSSSMNAMIYIRGQREDFDGWAEVAPGWSYEEVLPLFKRSERNERLGEPLHGTDGPLWVSDPRWLSDVGEPFIKACSVLGIDETRDFNGESQAGAGLFQLTQRNGRRWSAADGYLRPARRRRNLEVLTGATAHRVLFEGDRAVGVAYERGGAVRTVRAEREVILCAGAYGTPKLLMLSGIGPADHLRSLGIDVLRDHPHVGEHLMDHPMTTLTWEAKAERTLLDAESPKHLIPWARGRGKLTSNVAEAGAHVAVAGGERPDFQLLAGGAYYQDNGFRSWPGHALTIAQSLIRPSSEGSVRLRSADPADPPVIRVAYLSEAAELEAMVAAVELSREIASTRPLAGLVGRSIDPGDGVRSRADLETWVRGACQHTYHPSCTARMGPEGVLDAELRVRDVDGLRVADASAMPRVTSGNTHAPTVMIGERCADLLRGRGATAAARPHAVAG